MEAHSFILFQDMLLKEIEKQNNEDLRKELEQVQKENSFLKEDIEVHQSLLEDYREITSAPHGSLKHHLLSLVEEVKNPKPSKQELVLGQIVNDIREMLNLQIGESLKTRVQSLVKLENQVNGLKASIQGLGL